MGAAGFPCFGGLRAGPFDRLSMSWEGRKGGRSRDRIRASQAVGIWEGLRGLLG